jgi:hypothetical protein
MGWAAAQAEGPFSNASMDGVYAFLAGFGSSSDGPGPHSALWLVISYNGDGTAEIRTIGRNEPGESDSEGMPTRTASVARPDPSPSVEYDMNPDGTFVVRSTDGDVLWDGLIVRAEVVDGVLVATEYILFHHDPDPGTGGLLVGRGYRQRPR